MTLSIIILNYKTKNLVKQCIKNIENLKLNLDYGIVVVDNNSGDGIEEMVTEWQRDLSAHPSTNSGFARDRIRFIQTSENRGMGAGNNVGIQHAQGEYVLILNPDVVVLKDSIESLLAVIKSNPRIGIVAPQLLNPNKTFQQSCYRFPKFYIPLFIRTGLGRFAKKKLEEYFMDDLEHALPHQVDWVRGSALLCRKEVLNKINGFDERFFMYLEDTDLCRRMWQVGYEVWYVPQAKMIHYYFRQSGGNEWIKDLFKKMAWIHIVSWFKYFNKWSK